MPTDAKTDAEKNAAICQQCGAPLSRQAQYHHAKYCSRRCLGRSKSEQYLRMFWERVNKNAPNGCWEWTGSKRGMGYGMVDYRLHGVLYRIAHRFSWALHNGPIPDGLLVAHHCDNPPCVNPSHLFLTTRRGNFDDMVQKGRYYHGAARGEERPNAKLTDSAVLDIRRSGPSGVPTKILAQRYGVRPGTIRQVLRGENWKHVKELDANI